MSPPAPCAVYVFFMLENAYKKSLPVKDEKGYRSWYHLVSINARASFCSLLLIRANDPQERYNGLSRGNSRETVLSRLPGDLQCGSFRGRFAAHDLPSLADCYTYSS